MNIVLLSGLATAGLLMTGAPASASQGTASSKASIGLSRYNGNDRTYDYREPEYGPSIRPDNSAYDLSSDSSVAFAAPDGSSYSYDGDWQGEYVDSQGRVFEGEWQGRVTRHDGVGGPGYPAPRHPAPAPRRPAAGAPYGGADYNDGRYDDRDRGDYYNVPSGYEGYERCLKSNGVTGAAIGALLGGVAGNRIAGRGNRTGGTLVGAGIGGLLGVAVEKANDTCRQYRPREAGAQGYSYAPPRPQPAYGAGWQGGYYYYPQSAPTVTVISMAPVTTTTTTVIEEVYYETVRSAPRKKAVRKWKPNPTCACW